MAIGIELHDEPIEGGLTPDEFADFWTWARAYDRNSLLALFVFGEAITSSHPFAAFAQMNLDWFNRHRTDIPKEGEVVH